MNGESERAETQNRLRVVERTGAFSFILEYLDPTSEVEQTAAWETYQQKMNQREEELRQLNELIQRELLEVSEKQGQLEEAENRFANAFTKTMQKLHQTQIRDRRDTLKLLASYTEMILGTNPPEEIADVVSELVNTVRALKNPPPLEGIARCGVCWGGDCWCLDCGHLFCKKCFKRNPFCPLCRAGIKNPRKIYLN